MKIIFNKVVKIVLLICLSPQLVIAQKNKTNNLITKFCLESFKEEMSYAKINPPEGMASFTCDCFINSINKGYSVQKAQSICREKALEEFNF